MRERILLIVTVLILSLQNVTSTEFDPTYATTINGNCFMVGNTNTELDLAAGTEINESNEGGDIRNIINTPMSLDIFGSSQTLTIDNCNFAKFCIPNPNKECDTTDIEYARLSWGGRMVDGSIDHRNTVYLQITDDAGNGDGFHEVTADAGPIIPILKKSSEAGFYSCHANVTTLIKSILKKKPDDFNNSIKRIYVANVQSELKKASFLIEGLFSGWSLTIVYKHPTLAKKNIMIYDCDVLGEANENNNKPDPILADFNFGSEKDNILSDTITFGYAAFGGFREQAADRILTNRDSEEELITKYDNYASKRSIAFDDNTDNNVMGSAISYNYKTSECGDFSNIIDYSRGYDLRVFPISPEAYKKGTDSSKDSLFLGNSFNVCITPGNEYHFLTNAIVLIGAPDVPETKLAIATDQTSLEPGKEYKTTLYVTVGDNEEGMSNIKLNIPLSEYIDSVTAISIHVNKNINISGYKYAKITTSDGQSSLNQYLSSLNNNREDAQNGLLKTINSYLSSLNKTNENLATTDPTKIKNGLIELSFPNFEIPSSIKYQDAITIELTLKTKLNKDWTYEKTTLTGRKTIMTPQAELSVTGSNSQQTSVVESSSKKLETKKDWEDFKCELLLDLDGGSGGGTGGGIGGGGIGGGGDACSSGLNKVTTQHNGIYLKDKEAKKIEIAINAQGSCRLVPDTIKIPFCKEIRITIAEIDDLLKKRNVNADSIAKIDSCIWELAKRDSLVNFTKIHGVNKSQMEELLGLASNLSLFTSGGTFRDTLNAKLNCYADASLLTDSIDKIINMKRPVTSIYALFSEKDTLHKYDANQTYAINITDLSKKDEAFDVDKDTSLYLFYDSPWIIQKDSNDCDKYVVLQFIKKDITAPTLIYQGDTLAVNETLYYCLDGEIEPLTIIKDSLYDVYVDILDTLGNSHNDIIVDRTFRSTFNWSIKDNAKEYGSTDVLISTKYAGTSRLIFRQKSLTEDCAGENDTLFIKVSDFKIDKQPKIDKTFPIVCETMEAKDSIKLFVNKDDETKNYSVRWYKYKSSIIDKDILGVGDTIYVRKDTSGTFNFAAVYFRDKCESQPDYFTITINPKADTVKTDTMSICQHYKLTSKDVLDHLKTLNNNLQTNFLHFYNYDEGHSSDINENISDAITKDSVMLDDLLDKFDFDKDCTTDGVRNLNFVVRNQTSNGCYGAGSLITVKIMCFSKTAPEFAGPDSILYCVGDNPATDMNIFLSNTEKDKAKNKETWYWSKKGDAMPTYLYTGGENYSSQTSYDPKTSNATANQNDFFVVRVDSNRCISEADTFKIIVDSNINTYPRIDDTTKTISTTESIVNFTYCKGINPFSSDTLPTLGYPSADYLMEWYAKDNLKDDCDNLVTNGNVKKEKIIIDFQYPDTSIYCVRQSTQLGCKGPWLNVQIIVNDSVRNTPRPDTVVLCQGDDAVSIVMPELSTESLEPTYYDSAMNKISGDKAFIQTDSAGEFITSKKNNLFYISQTNKITRCEGKIIGIDAIINPKPHLPYPEKDTTVYLCANNEIDNLKTKIGADINVLDHNTKLVWEPEEYIKTDGNKSALYTVRQIDTVSLCKGEEINIEIKIEKTFDYKPFGKKEFCYGTTISLCDSMEKSIKANNKFIPDNNIGYKVYRLNGTSKQTPSLDCGQLSKLGSSKTRNTSDSTRYLIEVMDTISGCFEKDTATIIFRGLPTIKKIEDIVICQFVDTLLPTPTDNKYSYKWLREDDDQILPKPEKLQLTKSETIRLIANDEMGCYDTLAVNMVVNKEPKSAIAYSDTFCQNSGIHLVPVTINPSADINAGSIKIEWFGENNDPIKTPINTDTVNMTGLTKVFTYTIRQTVQGSNCHKDTNITITIKNAIDLKMLDLDRVCQPNTVDFDTKVWDYLGANTNDVNLANLNNIDVKYAMLNNGTKTDKTKEEVSKLEYMDGKDSVKYIYTVTDADKVCVASDTVFVTINRKPTTPIIENGLDTIYFCKDDAPIYLGAKDINPDQTKTDIFWGEYTSAYSNDSLNITESFKKYTAFTKNLETGCVSIPDTIVAYISNSVYFKSFGVKKYCHGEVVDLKDMIQKAIKNQNNPQFKSNIGFQVYKVNGTTPNAAPVSKDVLSSLHSMMGRNVDDSTRYYLEVLDSISGCNITDTFSIIFRGLPTIKKIDDIVVCQYADTLLPTPSDSRYEYHWLRANDKEILPMPAVLQLEKSETIRLVAVDTMDCKDTLAVYMDVKKIPTSAIAYNDTFCQNSGTHLIPVFSQASEDNESESLSIQWFSEQMDSIQRPINTDTVVMNEMKKVIPYIIRQTNSLTGCYKDTTILITINKALDLRMQDVERVCQPEIVDFDTKVWNYLKSNTAAVNLTNLDNIKVGYALLNNGNKKPMTKEEVAKLEYMEGKDSVSYIYTVTDGKKVCVASDTVFVTINRKPSIPVIENGMNTIYFCKDNAPLYIKAKDKNIDTTLTDIFWGEYKNGTKGDSLLISENKNDMLYIAYSQNNYTTCVSDPDSIIVVVASPIERKTIGKNGTIELCVNEHINVMDTAKASFIIDKKRLSVIKYSITANGFDIAENELADVTKTVQDTTYYVFTVKDELTGCETTNKLRLIFHQKPTFEIEGKNILCQGNNIELRAAGENRAVSYVWLTEGHDKVESTTSTFTMKNIIADTTILLVERLEGTSCYDTISKKITVYETPDQLEDREFLFCQDKTGLDEKVLIKRDEQDSIKFRLQWLDVDNTEMFVGETIDVPVANDTVYTYFIKQLNIQSDTVCHGKLSKVSFRINAHTDVTLRDTNVCMPDPFNLSQYVKTKRVESTTGYELKMDSVTFLSNGNESIIADPTQVTKTGIYRIHYTDKNGCNTKNTAKVNFINKPDKPVFKGDTPIYLCQSIDTTIVPNLIAGNYIYLWNKVGGNDTITSDTLNIEAKKSSGSPVQYQVWRKDSIYGCESDKAEISYQILDTIKITTPETLHICEYETIDLDSVGHQIFSSGGSLALQAYHSNEQGEILNQLLYFNAIRDSGYYIIKAKDVVSNCRSKALVKLDSHEAPVLLYNGNTILCDKEKLTLTAYPQEGKKIPIYQWTDTLGNNIDDQTISYISNLKEGSTVFRKDILLLTGTYNITNNKSCIKKRKIEIITNPIPATLENDTVDICQKTGTINIPVDYQNNVYNLKMYQKDSSEISSIDVITDSITNLVFTVKQEDRITKCLSQPANVFVNVRSAIQLELETTDGICEPEVFPLEEIINKAALSSNSSIIENKTYTINSITRNGIEVNDRNAVSQTGLYHVAISDQYGCLAGDTIRLTVNQQPNSISGDTAFCQNTGTQILKKQGSGKGLVVEWLDLESAYPDSVFTDSIKIKTDIAETRNYLIRQKFTSSNCASIPTPMTVAIHPAIHTDLKDTTICYGNTLDLPAYAQNHVSEGNEPSVYNYKRIGTIVPLDYHAIAQTGTFVVNYSDINNCKASNTMTLTVAPKIELALTGNKPVCAGDAIRLKASGAEHYVWNGASEDIDSINIATISAEITDIHLSASVDINDETSCNTDTIISITVNKVPDLIQNYGDTLYCQESGTQALSLNATDEDAKVLWYDPNDNYSAINQNGTLHPSSKYNGDFIYKFRQQLGECYTKMQDYHVNIQKSIEEVPVVRDTAYCKDEKTAPLSATWTNPLYELVWTDEQGTVLSDVYEPSSAMAGIKEYEAKLTFKACIGPTAKMKVSVQERYNEIPDVNDSFTFCENTGTYTLSVNKKKDGVRTNWYQEGSDTRLDSVSINTNASTWKNNSYVVTQSAINGCESLGKKVDVTIADEIKPMTIYIDTCANQNITIDDVMNLNHMTEEAESLWNGEDLVNRMDINSNIGHTGNYQLLVKNQYGCTAIHTIKVKMMEVEDFTYPNINKIYCHDDTITLQANSSNSTMTWEDQSTGFIHYGNTYGLTLDGETEISLIATITNKPACKDTIDFKIMTHPKTEAQIIGKTSVCLDSMIKLTTGNLYQTSWTVGDSTIIGDNFSYIPLKSELVQVYGFDKSQCPVSKIVTINTVNNPDPKIVINPIIASKGYHLNRDTFEVKLDGVITAPLDNNYTYYWEFGDGNKEIETNSSSIEHRYSEDLVRLTKPIDVKLLVTHEYGCKGEAVATILIDPDFDVPNTMAQGDVFMEDFELQIFDRIGNLIYEGIGWHGQKNNGEDAFADTYFYAITYYVAGEKKIKTGYITLVR